VQNDPQNCGDCGKACGKGDACSMGKCTLICRSGLNACPRSGGMAMDAGVSDAASEGGGSGGGLSASECVDFQTDSDNCGKCGMKCPNDKPFCDFGQCKLYKWNGILTNVNTDDLSGRWTECFTETYNSPGMTPLATITNKCPQANLMLACRQTMSKTLVVAAQAPRADVMFDVGTGSSAFHLANGTAWYFNSSYSWGFFNAVDTVQRSSCDTAKGLYPDHRMCWHTGGGTMNGGFRCGDTCAFNCANTTDLNSSTAYQKVIFQTP
jgi:hypothetical protein